MLSEKWTSTKRGIVIAYPNVRKAGMSSLGVHLVAQEAAKFHEFIVDEAYLAEKGDSRLERTIGRGNSLRDFSVIGFSCAFENDYPNLVRMLEKAGIPSLVSQRQEQRTTGSCFPGIVVGGGPALSANPLPLSRVLDFTFLLDAEASFATFLGMLAKNPGLCSDPSSWATELAHMQVPNIMASPALSRQRGGMSVQPARPPVELGVLDEYPWLGGAIFKELLGAQVMGAGLGDAYPLEIGRGCSTGCRFCLLSHHMRPPRFRGLASVKAILSDLAGAGLQGIRVNLIGSNASDHPDLAAICTAILDAGHGLSLPSIKGSTASELVPIIKRAGINTITIAPETGSDSLRCGINKPQASDEYAKLAEVLVEEGGVSKIKVYLIHGLPGETDEDRQETLSFVGRLSDSVRGRGAGLSVSLSLLTPKLGTPFMFHARPFTSEQFKETRRSSRHFSKEVGRASKSRLSAPSAREGRLQAYLSLGDASVIEWLNGGLESKENVIPDEEMDRVLVPFAEAAKKGPGALPKPQAAMIPAGLAFLYKEYLSALERVVSPPCTGTGLGCAGCGSIPCNPRVRDRPPPG